MCRSQSYNKNKFSFFLKKFYPLCDFFSNLMLQRYSGFERKRYFLKAIFIHTDQILNYTELSRDFWIHSALTLLRKVKAVNKLTYLRELLFSEQWEIISGKHWFCLTFAWLKMGLTPESCFGRVHSHWPLWTQNFHFYLRSKLNLFQWLIGLSKQIITISSRQVHWLSVSKGCER